MNQQVCIKCKLMAKIVLLEREYLHYLHLTKSNKCISGNIHKTTQMPISLCFSKFAEKKITLSIGIEPIVRIGWSFISLYVNKEQYYIM